jgi:hypothetical protein
METTESFEKPIVCTDAMKEHLLKAAGWSKFLAIMGFIGIGLMALMAIALLIGGGFVQSPPQPFGATGMAFLYLVLAVVYFFSPLYLIRFSNKVRSGILAGDTFEVTDAFKWLRQFFVFSGILAIIGFSILLLGLLFGLPLLFSL